MDAAVTQPWNVSWVRPGFGFRHYFQNAAGGEGYGEGLDRQWAYMVANASPSAAGRIANSIGESTPWPTLTDQDGATVGPLRYAVDSLEGFLLFAATTDPANMQAAFGVEGANNLKNRAWLNANNPQTNQGGLTRFEWFRRGVYLASRSPWWQKLYFKYYDDNLLSDAKAAFNSLGLKSELGLALLARSRNSSHSAMNRVRDAMRAALQRGESESSAIRKGADAYIAIKPNLYGGRVQKLYASHTMAPVGNISFARDLAIDAAPQLRQDGQPADTVGKSYDNDSLPWLAILILFAAYYWK